MRLDQKNPGDQCYAKSLDNQRDNCKQKKRTRCNRFGNLSGISLFFYIIVADYIEVTMEFDLEKAVGESEPIVLGG